MLHDTHISNWASTHGRALPSEPGNDLVLEEMEAVPGQFGRNAPHEGVEGDEGERALFAELGHHLVGGEHAVLAGSAQGLRVGHPYIASAVPEACCRHPLAIGIDLVQGVRCDPLPAL